jgi:DNA-binding MarR family transcriptional regulator
MIMSRFYIENEPVENAKLLAMLQSTARVGRTIIARQLLSTGLYAGQESVMELLAAEDGQTPGQIAEKLGVKPPTITKTITRLQEQNFVERRGSGDDARLIRVSLTDEGRAILEAMHQAIDEVELIALAGLKKKDRRHLARSLARIEANLRGDPAPGAKKKSGEKKKKKTGG